MYRSKTFQNACISSATVLGDVAVELFRSFCSGHNAIPIEDLRGMGICVSRLVDANNSVSSIKKNIFSHNKLVTNVMNEPNANEDNVKENNIISETINVNHDDSRIDESHLNALFLDKDQSIVASYGAEKLIHTLNCAGLPTILPTVGDYDSSDDNLFDEDDQEEDILGMVSFAVNSRRPREPKKDEFIDDSNVGDRSLNSKIEKDLCSYRTTSIAGINSSSMSTSRTGKRPIAVSPFKQQFKSNNFPRNSFRQEEDTVASNRPMKRLRFDDETARIREDSGSHSNPSDRISKYRNLNMTSPSHRGSDDDVTLTQVNFNPNHIIIYFYFHFVPFQLEFLAALPPSLRKDQMEYILRHNKSSSSTSIAVVPTGHCIQPTVENNVQKIMTMIESNNTLNDTIMYKEDNHNHQLELLMPRETVSYTVNYDSMKLLGWMIRKLLWTRNNLPHLHCSNNNNNNSNNNSHHKFQINPYQEQSDVNNTIVSAYNSDVLCQNEKLNSANVSTSNVSGGEYRKECAIPSCVWLSENMLTLRRALQDWREQVGNQVRIYTAFQHSHFFLSLRLLFDIFLFKLSQAHLNLLLEYGAQLVHSGRLDQVTITSFDRFINAYIHLFI